MDVNYRSTRACSTPYGQPGEGAVRYAKRMAQHVARILASPLKGVYSTHIDSAQQFGRHWHDTYGFGFLEHGAQEWFSGRGVVRGYPGEVITTNPGEVHDGRPLGPPTRRWRIVYVDVDVMTTLTAPERGAGGHVEITSPVIKDAMLSGSCRVCFRVSSAGTIARHTRDRWIP